MLESGESFLEARNQKNGGMRATWFASAGFEGGGRGHIQGKLSGL
jgi:hypothetical protein